MLTQITMESVIIMTLSIVLVMAPGPEIVQEPEAVPVTVRAAAADIAADITPEADADTAGTTADI